MMMIIMIKSSMEFFNGRQYYGITSDENVNRVPTTEKQMH